MTKFKKGDKVNFLWTQSAEEAHLAENGTVYMVFDEYIVVRPYYSREFLECQPYELSLRK